VVVVSIDPTVDLRVEPAQSERHLGELVGDLSREFSVLVRQEVELAKAELREEASKAAKAGGMLGGASIAALFTLLLLSFALAWGLAEAVPEGVAFLIVGAIYAIAAALLFVTGRARMRDVHPVPDETVDTLKEDVQWAKAQLK
jgi:hypothetical protein